MISKYLLMMCYDSDISVSVHNNYHDVSYELKCMDFDSEAIDEILIGDTYLDEADGGCVRVKRIDVHGESN